MLRKILIFGYVSTVGINPNQIDFQNWVLCVAENAYQAYQGPIKHPKWHVKDSPSELFDWFQLLLVTPMRCNRTHNSLFETKQWFIIRTVAFMYEITLLRILWLKLLAEWEIIIKHWVDLFHLNLTRFSKSSNIRAG